MKAEMKNTLLTFVDEIGDRGHSKKSSEYFAMAAVVCPVDVQQKVKDCIVKIKGIKIIFVISDKKTMPDDHEKFYNIVAAYTMERILKYADELKTKVCVRFGHVKSFRHSTTLEYFQKRNWRLGQYGSLMEQPKWIAAETNSGIQLADLYAGILGAAMIADKFGNFEASYLDKIKHQIRTSSKGKISGYGIKAISEDNNPKTFKWWPPGWE